MDNKIQNTKVAELMQSRPTAGSAQTAGPGPAFEAILRDRLKVSGHAQTRLASRNIELGKDQWERVLLGVQKAEAKGARESLVMVDDVALIVSVKNRTIITAVDQGNLKENVFTNIDSALFV